METFNFSNSNIDLACEEVGKFLASAGVDRREALRLKLTFEEVLLEYQSKFGEDATYKLKCIKRFSAIRVEMTVQGGLRCLIKKHYVKRFSKYIGGK